MPYVELCVDCQQTKDGGRPTGGRRHLRDFRWPPRAPLRFGDPRRRPEL